MIEDDCVEDGVPLRHTTTSDVLELKSSRGRTARSGRTSCSALRPNRYALECRREEGFGTQPPATSRLKTVTHPLSPLPCLQVTKLPPVLLPCRRHQRSSKGISHRKEQNNQRQAGGETQRTSAARESTGQATAESPEDQ